MKSNNKRLVLGGIFVLIGIVLLLRNAGVLYFDIPFDIFSWQVIFIIVGGIIIYSTGKIIPGAIFIAIAFFNWYPNLWPLILVAIGLGIIYKKSDNKKNELKDKSSFSADKLDDVAVFGGGHKILDSSNFKGGDAVAVFGGSEIDLTNCKLAEGEQVLELVAVFGGTTFIVPKEWNVQIDVVAIFGGFSDKRIKYPDTVRDTSRSLKITGLVLFGGGEVK
jgi:predicted membrane protein